MPVRARVGRLRRPAEPLIEPAPQTAAASTERLRRALRCRETLRSVPKIRWSTRKSRASARGVNTAPFCFGQRSAEGAPERWEWFGREDGLHQVNSIIATAIC